MLECKIEINKIEETLLSNREWMRDSHDMLIPIIILQINRTKQHIQIKKE